MFQKVFCMGKNILKSNFEKVIKAKKQRYGRIFSSSLNPQGGYIKIDAYLLHILCHITSDVKFPHYFLLIKVK